MLVLKVEVNRDGLRDTGDGESMLETNRIIVSRLTEVHLLLDNA